MTPVDSGMDGEAGPTSVEEDELPLPVTVKVRVPVLVVCDVVVPVGPTGEVKLEKEDGVAGEPSVEDELPPVGIGRVIVYVVPIEIVTLLVTGTLLEAPVGPAGKLSVPE